MYKFDKNQAFMRQNSHDNKSNGYFRRQACSLIYVRRAYAEFRSVKRGNCQPNKGLNLTLGKETSARLKHMNGGHNLNIYTGMKYLLVAFLLILGIILWRLSHSNRIGGAALDRAEKIGSLIAVVAALLVILFPQLTYIPELEQIADDGNNNQTLSPQAPSQEETIIALETLIVAPSSSEEIEILDDTTRVPTVVEPTETINLPAATIELSVTPYFIKYPYTIQIDKTVPGGHSGFSLTVERVELLDKQTMRWYVSFFNQGADYDLWVNLDASYIADEFGNRYAIVATDQTERTTIPNGVKREYWFEFENPQNNAKDFEVRFIKNAILSVGFPQFELRFRMPSNAQIPFESMPTSTPILGAITVYEINETFRTDSSGFTVNLERVEVANDGRMRWILTFFNQSKEDIDIFFNLGATYLTDEMGNQYSLIETNQLSRTTLQKDVKVSYWFEFDSPIDEASLFQFHMSKNAILSIGIPSFTVELR